MSESRQAWAERLHENYIAEIDALHRRVDTLEDTLLWVAEHGDTVPAGEVMRAVKRALGIGGCAPAS